MLVMIVLYEQPARSVGIIGIVGMALAIQAMHAPVVPAGLQGTSQAAKPSPIAGISVLIWPMRKLKIEMTHSAEVPPPAPLSPLVSLSLLLLLLL